jgi:hypothetical protein
VETPNAWAAYTKTDTLPDERHSDPRKPELLRRLNPPIDSDADR